MAVKRSPADDHHAFLAFSFEVSNSTEVLSIDGTHFRPVSLPGLVTIEASKLVTTTSGGWLVQANAAGAVQYWHCCSAAWSQRPQAAALSI